MQMLGGMHCAAHVLRPEDMSGAVHATQHLHRQPVSEQRLIAKVVKRQRQIGDLDRRFAFVV